MRLTVQGGPKVAHLLIKYVNVHSHREEITFFARKHNLFTSEDENYVTMTSFNESGTK